MAFDAKVYRVMIASPSDVAAERQLVREVVAEWTAIHSADKRAVLLPVAWESHAAPEMGDRAQGIINRRLLKDCDVLVAAFWTRIGSPTGEAASGTVEEIEEHIKAGKETMIYFSQAPVRPDSVDPDQYEQLKKFKKECESRGLYDTYESLAEFREKLTRQLAVTMIRVVAGAPHGKDTAIAVPAVTVQVPPSSQHERLSRTAQVLLKCASLDKNGSFLRVNVMDGAILQANGRQLNTQGDARDMARWDGAIDELERAGLINATSNKREIFKLTHRGYDAADRIVLEP